MELKMFKNRKLEIDFFHVDSFEVSVYLPILKELSELGIKCRPVIPTSKSGLVEKDYLDNIEAKAFYKKYGIESYENPNFSNPVCSTQGSEFLSLYLGPKIRIPYGPGIFPEGWGLTRKSCLGFSDILVHGSHYHTHLSKFFNSRNIHISGYPKFDRFFAREAARTVNELGDSRPKGHDEPTPRLLILPTWGESSSLLNLIESIKLLNFRYNITIKPHHLSLRKEPQLVEIARGIPRLRIVEQSDSLIDLLLESDFVVCDVRSCVFVEAILARKRTVAISSHEDDEKWIREANVLDVAPVVTCYEDLPEELERLSLKDKFESEREQWIAQKVAFRDGTSGLESANIIASIARLSSKRGLRPSAWIIFSKMLSFLCKHSLISCKTARALTSRTHWLIIKLLGNL